MITGLIQDLPNTPTYTCLDGLFSILLIAHFNNLQKLVFTSFNNLAGYEKRNLDYNTRRTYEYEIGKRAANELPLKSYDNVVLRSIRNAATYLATVHTYTAGMEEFLCTNYFQCNDFNNSPV